MIQQIWRRQEDYSDGEDGEMVPVLEGATELSLYQTAPPAFFNQTHGLFLNETELPMTQDQEQPGLAQQLVLAGDNLLTLPKKVYFTSKVK